ncbi:MAG: hypothetical protein WCP39_02645 [Chlamydiota bacterium]
MKKLFITLIIFFITGFFLWNTLPWTLSKYLSNNFDLPVSVKRLSITPFSLTLHEFSIDNLLPAKTKKAFVARSIAIHTTIPKLRGNPLTVNSIELKDIDIYVELYDKSGQKNNWKDILQSGLHNESPSSRSYIIEKITLDQIRITLIDSEGKITRIPGINHLEFLNLSNKSGFPIEKLEKAILYTIMKSVYQSAGLQNLLDSLNPFRLAPQLFQIPFLGKNSPTSTQTHPPIK